jgi:hypothetical protein
MNWTPIGIWVLSLGILCSVSAGAGHRIPDRTSVETDATALSRTCRRAAAGRLCGQKALVLAQGETRIPSDAQLERMEERAMTTPPLDVGGAPPRLPGGEEAEIRQMNERARRIDERLMNGGAICSDCK